MKITGRSSAVDRGEWHLVPARGTDAWTAYAPDYNASPDKAGKSIKFTSQQQARAWIARLPGGQYVTVDWHVRAPTKRGGLLWP